MAHSSLYSVTKTETVKAEVRENYNAIKLKNYKWTSFSNRKIIKYDRICERILLKYTLSIITHYINPIFIILYVENWEGRNIKLLVKTAFIHLFDLLILIQDYRGQVPAYQLRFSDKWKMSWCSLIRILLQPSMCWCKPKKSFHIIHEGILAAVKILLW